MGFKNFAVHYSCQVFFVILFQNSS